MAPAVPDRPEPLSRLYLIPALGAVVLGIAALIAHLRQPSFPALPGRGCIVTTFPGPDSLPSPRPYLELNACLHISETLLDLDYYPAPGEGPSVVFEGSVEEDPRQWARVVAIRWRTADALEVRFRSDLVFTRRSTSFGAGRVVYIPLR
jgi:hypothetical protein